MSRQTSLLNIVATTSLIAIGLKMSACSSTAKKEEAQPAKAPTASAATAAGATSKKAAKATNKSATAKTETAKADAGDAKSVTCKSGSTVREIAVVSKDGHCAVNYTKDGNTSEIATGALSGAHCKETQTKVKENLVKAGYTCE
jgi:hypothetical protein